MTSKENILTSYVNRIGFGHLTYGLRSASLYYFAKEPRNLTKAEQIALLVIPKNPRKYDPYTHPEPFRERYSQIISTLLAGGIISAIDADAIASEKLTFVDTHKPTLPYVVDFIRSRIDALPSVYTGTLRTTIDYALTTRIESISRSALDELSWRNVSDYGILIAERSKK